jgi:hypothetical protein
MDLTHCWKDSLDGRLPCRKAATFTQDNTNTEETQTDIHASSGIRTHDSNVWAAQEILCLRSRSHCDQHNAIYKVRNYFPLPGRHILWNIYLPEEYFRQELQAWWRASYPTPAVFMRSRVWENVLSSIWVDQYKPKLNLPRLLLVCIEPHSKFYANPFSNLGHNVQTKECSLHIMRSLLVLYAKNSSIHIDAHDRDAMSFLGGWNRIFMNIL